MIGFLVFVGVAVIFAVWWLFRPAVEPTDSATRDMVAKLRSIPISRWEWVDGPPGIPVFAVTTEHGAKVTLRKGGWDHPPWCNLSVTAEGHAGDFTGGDVDSLFDTVVKHKYPEMRRRYEERQAREQESEAQRKRDFLDRL